MEPVKILIADNQYLTRTGLKSYIAGMSIITSHSEVFNKEDLYNTLSNEHPRILIIDFDFFDLNSIDDLAEIRTKFPDTTIIILTNNIEPQQIEKTLETGINIYVHKTTEREDLDAAIHAALNNKKFFTEEILDILVKKKSKVKLNPSDSHLTNAETEIIKMITEGLTTKEIAAKKYLSVHTIITHRKNIFKKLGINNTSELVSYAFRSGIVDRTEYYI